MSTKKDSTASAANGGSATVATTTNYEARLCHVVKRPDFDGYGFNLHAEKGRPGQYIGKVDDGSPAEAAGLRQGDRIIEVNGTNITVETHKKVVELIKGVLNETRLLVIDPRADAEEMKAAIAKSKLGQVSNGGVDVNDNSKQPDLGGAEQHMMTNGGTKDSQQSKNKHDVNGTTSNGNEDANSKKKSNSSVDSSANKSATMMTNGGGGDASPKKQQPAVDQIIEDTKAMSVGNGSATTKQAMNGGSNGSSASSKDGPPKLNLNMTAAELRAQLAARKKYDPKNDVCDLRKKYEIIQKM